ncbi:uncharacterized protein Tco025E_08424 [Trypanosoma conorhini]|uniref:Uncharacterized protein n=1 Tax=Trypanosoma conorhini TaxID=83891 RepID=A0A3R7MGV3_9TRYP|nr:uncharacterized protein Tco025E_08424 [Trypanosoma conorhini]RNF02285.1 hypothetical protein Tco025E_08424 [Trypanosoma conorhini]
MAHTPRGLGLTAAARVDRSHSSSLASDARDEAVAAEEEEGLWHCNEHRPEEAGLTARVSRCSMHAVVKGLAQSFWEGRETCVEVSRAEPLHPQRASLESSVQLSEERPSCGSSPCFFSPNAEQKETVPSIKNCVLLGCSLPALAPTELPQGASGNGFHEVGSSSPPAPNEPSPTETAGDGAAITGLFACFCEAVMERTPGWKLFVSFVEREGGRWLDLSYQMPGPTSLPLHLRRYAVREITALPRASFHCITSVREVIDFSLKVMRNRPPRKSAVQKTGGLLIQVLGVADDAEFHGEGETPVAPLGVRSIKFTQPAASSALAEVWGLHVFGSVPSRVAERRELVAGSAGAGAQGRRLLRAIGCEGPISVVVRHLSDAATLPSFCNPKKTFAKGVVGHAGVGQHPLRPSLHQEWRGRQRMGDAENCETPSKEVKLNVEAVPGASAKKTSAPSEAAIVCSSCDNFSMAALARHTLRCLQLQRNMNDCPASSPRAAMSPSCSKPDFFAPVCKNSPLAPIRTKHDCDARTAVPAKAPSRDDGMESLIKALERRWKSGVHRCPNRRKPLLPIFYGLKKPYWQRESLMSLELEERSLIELEEKRRRRLSEAKIGQILCDPHHGARSPPITSVVRRAKTREKSFLFLSPFP